MQPSTQALTRLALATRNTPRAGAAREIRLPPKLTSEIQEQIALAKALSPETNAAAPERPRTLRARTTLHVQTKPALSFFFQAGDGIRDGRRLPARSRLHA